VRAAGLEGGTVVRGGKGGRIRRSYIGLVINCTKPKYNVQKKQTDLDRPVLSCMIGERQEQSWGLRRGKWGKDPGGDTKYEPKAQR